MCATSTVRPSAPGWRLVAAAALLLGRLGAAAPVNPPAPAGTPSPASAFASYGPPEPLDLWRIANNGAQYHRTNATTSGDLRVLPSSNQYLILSDGAARVLIIPAMGDLREASRLIGRRVQLEGIVRVLPSRQETVG